MRILFGIVATAVLLAGAARAETIRVGVTVVFDPAPPRRKPDQKRGDVRIVCLLPELAEMGDLPCAARYEPCGRRFRQQHTFHIATFEQCKICGRRSKNHLDVAFQIDAVTRRDDARELILLAALGLRCDALSDQVAGGEIGTIAANDPSDVQVGPGTEQYQVGAARIEIDSPDCAGERDVQRPTDQLDLHLSGIAGHPFDIKDSFSAAGIASISLA